MFESNEQSKQLPQTFKILEMTVLKTKIDRRSFLKTSALAGGGLMVSFSWLASGIAEATNPEDDKWYELNGFLKIHPNGSVTIMSPNPEIGQNVKTSMPMIVAEELDVNWDDVIVEQAPLNTDIFTRQLAGGSQSIRQGWKSLRMAGATARFVLLEAAAKQWGVPVNELTVSKGIVEYQAGNKKIGYGELAADAVKIEVPEEVTLKDIKDFKIIRTARENVDGPGIVTGKPLFGLDYKKKGMLIATIEHPPAFGMKIKSLDAGKAKAMPGIVDVFTFKSYNDDYAKAWSDVSAFNELIAIVGESTWQVFAAKKALEVSWENTGMQKVKQQGRGDEVYEEELPAEMESSDSQMQSMIARAKESAEERRKDGDPEKAFAEAAKIIERTYTAPYLAHNTLEPMNFFADVTDDKATLVGPIQTPEYMEKSVAARLRMSLEQIDIQMTRMGGGFGRRLYGHFLVEAAVISQRMKKPVKLVYTREDDMTFGCYRPTYHATYRAALDENNNMTAFHVKAGGIPSNPLFPDRFPAGSVDNYLAESWEIKSNVSTGAWRAPRSNFIAGVEQAFLDEVAEAAEKDPIDFRLELLERAKSNPVGEKNDYDAERYAGVLKLVREKSGWDNKDNLIHQGVSAYYCHNSYVANVVEMRIEDDKPYIDNVHCAVDCGIVVNPLGATNMIEGGTIDGIGHAMYSQITLKDGVPEQSNFNRYKLIRHHQAPKDIKVYFVDSDVDPTGLGEPPFPTVIGALANALYKATGKRFYSQPFMIADQEEFI